MCTCVCNVLINSTCLRYFYMHVSVHDTTAFAAELEGDSVCVCVRVYDDNNDCFQV
jgi:hypothetical protein